MLLLNRDANDHRALLESLKPFVADAPSLIAIIDNRLKPQAGSAELRRMKPNMRSTKSRRTGKRPRRMPVGSYSGGRSRKSRGRCLRRVAPRIQHGIFGKPSKDQGSKVEPRAGTDASSRRNLAGTLQIGFAKP